MKYQIEGREVRVVKFDIGDLLREAGLNPAECYVKESSLTSGRLAEGQNGSLELVIIKVIQRN